MQGRRSEPASGAGTYRLHDRQVDETLWRTKFLLEFALDLQQIDLLLALGLVEC